MSFLSIPIPFSNQGYDLSQGTLTWLQYAQLESQVIFDSDKIERLQRRAARIINFKAVSKLSTDQIMTKLGLELLYYRRRTHILRFGDECIANRVPRYLSNYFNVRNHDIHRHKTRNNNDLILERINLECTKRAFFCKGAKIFNNF